MRRLAVLALVAAAAPAFASEEDLGPPGELNPEELTLESTIAKAARGETSMTVCAQGYYVTKWGKHEQARLLFERCAADGWTGAMTWMSQLEANGLGAPEDIEAAADWDRMAADAGDPVGQFNYGLDLLRGHGVARDEAAGRALVDRAAGAGLATAERLRAAGYDPAAVTPDADEWRYQRIY